MIEPIELVERAAQRVAALHIDTPRAQIQHVMGPGIGEAMAAARAQGVGPTGPWFAHHLAMTAGAFNFDICVPVSDPITPVGRVTAWLRPVQQVVRTVYHGPYEGLGDAWHAFTDAIAAAGHKTADDLYECYLVGPESSDNPADWRTELSRPVIGQR